MSNQIKKQNNMKTTKLLSALFAASVFTVAQAQTDVTLNWHSELIALNGTTQIAEAKINAAGDVFEIANFGSGANSEEISFMNATFKGDTYTGSSSAGLTNFLLLKHDLNGNLKWRVYSRRGEASISDCALAPTADGGAFIALKLRPNVSGGDSTVLVTLVDGTDAETTIDFALPKSDYAWAYQPLLVKVDADGRIAYTNLLKCDWAPAPADAAGKKVTNGFYFCDATEDADGNIYVVGRQCRDLVIGAQTIAHHNTDDWSGDSQTACGNAFLLKLNSDLSYNNHVCTGGRATQDVFKNVRCHNGKIYLTGIVQPNTAKEAITFGGKSITPTAETMAIVSACLDAATLQADWLAQNNVNSSVQIEDLALSNDHNSLFIAGGIQENKTSAPTLTVSESLILTGNSTMYQGFVLELDAATGAGLRGLIKNTTSIAKIYNVIATADSVFAYGYDWSSKAIFLDSYNTDLASGATYNLLQGGGMPTAWACAAQGDTLVTISRAQKTTSISWLGSDDTFKPAASGNFYGVISCFTLDGRNFTPKKPVGPTTAIGTTVNAETEIYAGYRTLTIVGAAGQNVSVFNVLGQKITNFTAADYETRSLPQGIYMVAVGERTTKVVVR